MAEEYSARAEDYFLSMAEDSGPEYSDHKEDWRASWQAVRQFMASGLPDSNGIEYEVEFWQEACDAWYSRLLAERRLANKWPITGRLMALRYGISKVSDFIPQGG